MRFFISIIEDSVAPASRSAFGRISDASVRRRPRAAALKVARIFKAPPSSGGALLLPDFRLAARYLCRALTLHAFMLFTSAGPVPVGASSLRMLCLRLATREANPAAIVARASR